MNQNDLFQAISKLVNDYEQEHDVIIACGICIKPLDTSIAIVDVSYDGEKFVPNER